MRSLAALCAAAALSTLPATALAIDANALDGAWEGFYFCGQGPTNLVLTLDGEADGRVTGTFAFGPRSNNPYVASGRFRLEGSVGADQQITLQGVQWLEQPYGYSMVGLSGRLFKGVKPGDPPLLMGKVLGGSGCSDFTVDKR